MINPGKFNKYIAFKKQNDDGSYSTVAESWADINPLNSRQILEAKAVNSDITTEITTRYRKDVDRSMTIFYGSRQFEIDSAPINIGEKNQYLKFICREINV